MNLDSIKLKMSAEGKVTISVDDEEYRLVMIGFGKGTVVYQYMNAGELHSIIVGPDHYNKYGKLVVEKVDDTRSEV